ncbi:MAG TPA: hypothetical protein PK760_04820 [Flavobacteriales bacterium]|nr:hypothetical protein [Flavobacteriales bacterium]
MKAIKAILIIVSLATTTLVNAQATTVQEEIRATSGQLKETYGAVSQQLAMLNRTIGPDAAKATADQAAKRNQLKTALTKLEGILTTVNTANEADWAAIKAKAATVGAEAKALLPVKEEFKK